MLAFAGIVLVQIALIILLSGFKFKPVPARSINGTSAVWDRSLQTWVITAPSEGDKQ